MNKLLGVLAVALTPVLFAFSQTAHEKKSPLDGTWELVSGQPLPKGARDVKIISGGHFIFVAYDAENGKPLYTGGGTYVLNKSSYTEHMDFASDQIATGLMVRTSRSLYKWREILSRKQALSRMGNLYLKSGSG